MHRTIKNALSLAVLAASIGILAAVTLSPACSRGMTGDGKDDATITSEQQLDEVAQFIRNHVENEEPKGMVTIENPDTGETLELKLDKVHRKRLAKIEADTYFVCADFKADDGTVYDLDFFVRRKNGDAFKLIKDKTSLHKVAGEPRYTWYYDEVDGVWKKRSQHGGAEHPDAEHPDAEHPDAEHPDNGAEHPN